MQPRHHSRNPDRTSPGDGNRSLCESRTTYDEALGPYTHSGIGHRRYAAAGAATRPAAPGGGAAARAFGRGIPTRRARGWSGCTL